jgi:hypothetical protein
LVRNIVVATILFFSLSALFVGDIIQTGCGYLFAYHSYVLNAPILQYTKSIVWLIDGVLFLFFAIFILPGLCITLTKQIQNIVNNSKNLIATNHLKISQNKKDIRMNIGQLIIAIYMIFCLLPSCSFFLTGVGIAFYLLYIRNPLILNKRSK